jgi:hypothetical protein
MKLKAIIITALTLALCSPTLLSCKKEVRTHNDGDDDEQIEKTVDIDDDNLKEFLEGMQIEFDKINAQCPVSVDEMTVLNGIVIRGTTVYYEYYVDEDELGDNVTILRDNSDVKKTIRDQIREGIGAEAISELKSFGVKVKAHYTGSNSDETVTITIVD